MLRAAVSSLGFGFLTYLFLNGWGAVRVFVLGHPHWVTDSLGTGVGPDQQFEFGLKLTLAIVVPWLLIFFVIAAIQRKRLAELSTGRLALACTCAALLCTVCGAALAPLGIIPQPLLLILPPLVLIPCVEAAAPA